MTFRLLDQRTNRVLLSAGVFVASLLPLTVGCQRRLSQEELGTVVFEASELPGAGTTYTRPEMALPAQIPTKEAVELPGKIDEPQ